MPIVGFWMLAQDSPAGHTGFARSQYMRQKPSTPFVVTQPVPGLQSALGLHAPSTGTLPAGPQ